MKFAHRAVDASTFETARWRWTNVVEVPASAADTFKTFEDPAQWPQWFKGIRTVTWTTEKPFGVGTTRTVVLDALTVYETFFRWQTGQGFSFFMNHTTVPFVHSMAEDYVLEDLSPARCRFTYRVAVEPNLIGLMVSPVLRPSLGKMFAAAAQALPGHMSARR